VPGGFHQTCVVGVTEGTGYTFVLDGRLERPDPASRGLAGGPLGRSVVVYTPRGRSLDLSQLVDGGLRASTVHDGDEVWRRGPTWSGADLAGFLHARPGDAIRLTAICEPSPDCGLPAALFAPTRAHGGARALRSLVSAAHQVGLAVVLRLPFDRLAPESAYLLDFGPWLEAGSDGVSYRLALGIPQVRSLAVETMLGWIAEYDVDLLELGVAGCWTGLPELVGEFAGRSTALGLRERPHRLVLPASPEPPRPFASAPTDEREDVGSPAYSAGEPTSPTGPLLRRDG
jgi:maltooligosyltrehalose trehalohydrolase